MFSAIEVKIIAYALAFIVVAAGVWRFAVYHEDVGYQRAKSICTADKLIAEQAANKLEEDYKTQLKKANHDSEERQAALAADIANITVQLNRLRVERSQMRSRIAQLSATACHSVADSCVEVFGECTDRYSKLAEETGRIVSDCQTVVDSWPK